MSPLAAFDSLNRYPPMYWAARTQLAIQKLNRLLRTAPHERLSSFRLIPNHSPYTSMMGETDVFDSFCLSYPSGAQEFMLSWGSIMVDVRSKFDLLRLLSLEAERQIVHDINGYYIAKDRATNGLIPFVVETTLVDGVQTQILQVLKGKKWMDCTKSYYLHQRD